MCLVYTRVRYLLRGSGVGGGAPLAASSEHSDLKPKKHSDLKPKNFQIHSDAVMLVCPWLGLAVMCVLRHG